MLQHLEDITSLAELIEYLHQQIPLQAPIGVFGVIPTFGRMLNEKLGVTFDRVETNPHSAMSMFNPLDEFQLNIYQKAVDEIYDTFVNRVANGRQSLEVNDVHKIAKGRVWTAEKALDHELIDEIEQ